jgi:hypothetical protein
MITPLPLFALIFVVKQVELRAFSGFSIDQPHDAKKDRAKNPEEKLTDKANSKTQFPTHVNPLLANPNTKLKHNQS